MKLIEDTIFELVTANPRHTWRSLIAGKSRPTATIAPLRPTAIALVVLLFFASGFAPAADDGETGVGTAPLDLGDDVLQIPEVAKAATALESALVKAKQKYSARLGALSKSLLQSGNLEIAKALEVEKEFVRSPRASSDATLSSAELSAAQSAYNKEADTARREFIRALDTAQTEQVKKGNVALATRLMEAAVRQRSLTSVDPAILGSFDTGKGVWGILSLNNHNVELKLNSKERNDHSLETVKLDQKYLFKWSNGNDAMWLEQMPDGLYLSCYTRYYDTHKFAPEKPTGNPGWSHKLFRAK